MEGKPSPAGQGLYMGTAALSRRDYVHRASIARISLTIAIDYDAAVEAAFLRPGRRPVLSAILPATVECSFHQPISTSIPTLRCSPTGSNSCQGAGATSRKSGAYRRPRRRRALSDAAADAFTVLRQGDAGRPDAVTSATRSLAGLVCAEYAPLLITRFCSTMRLPLWALACPRRSAWLALAGLPACCCRLQQPSRSMNSQELETAVRLRLNLVLLVLVDHAYGMIRWKQAVDRFPPDYGCSMTFGDPGLRPCRAWREGQQVESADGLARAGSRLRRRGRASGVDADQAIR